jgi:DnaJ-class molecular chaperone
MNERYILDTATGKLEKLPTCPSCFGDGTVTNGSAGPDTAPGSVTFCPTCFGRGHVAQASEVSR